MSLCSNFELICVEHAHHLQWPPLLYPIWCYHNCAQHIYAILLADPSIQWALVDILTWVSINTSKDLQWNLCHMFASIYFELRYIVGPYMVTLPYWTSIFEWYTTLVVVMSKCQENPHYNGIGLCAQNKWLIYFMGSIVNTIGGTYVITYVNLYASQLWLR